MLTLHIQVSSGRTYNAQVQGRPELVMPPISTQLFAEFQHSQFPSQVQIGHRTLELVGAPSVPISHTRSAQASERTWKRIQTRLPIAEECEFMANLGGWNQGIGTVGRIWALAIKMVPSPELPNPSPITHPHGERGPCPRAL